MHLVIPTRADVERLASARDQFSVTIYLTTSTLPTDTELNQLRARTLVEDAIARVRENADRHTADAIEEHLVTLLHDTHFWSEMGRSVAVFATPTEIIEFRLPNELTGYVSVTDRFTITPLLRAVTFPHAALVLALSQNGARLVKVSGDGPAVEVDVPTMPRNTEIDMGMKVQLTQYARAVDHALRPIVNGYALPLILAATEPLASIYRNLSGHKHLVTIRTLRGNPETLSEAQLADDAREVLDELYVAELADLRENFMQRRSEGRASTDLSDLASAAAFGNIATLAVDMDAEIQGSVGDDGSLALDDGTGHDAIEEIARRAIAAGAHVLSVRRADLPEDVVAAGIFRYAP